MIENVRLLKVGSWIVNYVKWRLLGLLAPRPGRSIPRIWRGARILNPARVRLGPYVQLRPYSVVRGVPGTIEIGAHSGIGDYTIVNAVESISIGERVMIAAGCHITDADHEMDGRGPMQTQGRRADPVVIEDEAWLGAAVMITAGVRIGKGAVVGAGAVVTRSVEPFEIVAGVPARKIGSREELPSSPS
jgi:acetyltransferase-like isoleucine patch superfamily enzyme